MPAWVDESVNVRHGVYLLGAYFCTPDQEEGTRRAVINSPLGQRRRFHWRNERRALRRSAQELLEALPGELILVNGVGLTNSRQERARQLCVRELLLFLETVGVTHVIFERRDPLLNRRDIRTLEGLRGAQWIGPATHLSHGDPHKDQLLWIPDALCGLSSRALVAGEKPSGPIHVITIDVT
jgi:hypothetical protein